MTSQNSSKKTSQKKRLPVWMWAILLPAWTYISFFMANMLVGGGLWLLGQSGLRISEEYQIPFTTGLSALIYCLALAVAVFVPFYIVKQRTSRRELGLTGLPSWLDIILPVPSFILYFITTAVVIAIVSSLLPLDLYQQQRLPFEAETVSTQVQYGLVFFTLVILAPVAEEFLFRGYLYGKLRNKLSIIGSIIIASITFGLAHLWAGGDELQWKVALDTCVLSVFLCLLREYTGAIWASILLHAAKNCLAFYLLFINPFIIQDTVTVIRSVVG